MMMCLGELSRGKEKVVVWYRGNLVPQGENRLERKVRVGGAGIRYVHVGKVFARVGACGMSV